MLDKPVTSERRITLLVFVFLGKFSNIDKKVDYVILFMEKEERYERVLEKVCFQMAEVAPRGLQSQD